jgi:hypothetical protein
MATIKTVTLNLAPGEPEDARILAELQATGAFRFQGQLFEATSIRTSRNGVTLTAKPEESE